MGLGSKLVKLCVYCTGCGCLHLRSLQVFESTGSLWCVEDIESAIVLKFSKGPKDEDKSKACVVIACWNSIYILTEVCVTVKSKNLSTIAPKFLWFCPVRTWTEHLLTVKPAH